MNEALAYFTRTVTGEKEAATPAHLVSVSKREPRPTGGLARLQPPAASGMVNGPEVAAARYALGEWAFPIGRRARGFWLSDSPMYSLHRWSQSCSAWWYVRERSICSRSIRRRVMISWLRAMDSASRAASVLWK